MPRKIAPLALVLAVIAATTSFAAPPVPGTGAKLDQFGDDFEDESWSFTHNFPKSSEEQDKQQRLPGGFSDNSRWYEGVKRGQPDLIRRVPTPPGGLAGSEGALLLRSLRTGIPGRPSFTMQQDDFIANVDSQIGRPIPVGRTPSVVARVYFPPVEEWENRTGPTFAFRVALSTHVQKKSSRGRFASTNWTNEPYYPGFFVEFQAKEQTGLKYDTGYIRIRANSYGGDFKAIDIGQTGWWTLGMSVTSDGQVHYFAKPGIEDLTAEDHITSQFPYGYRAEGFKTFFFNVCNGDDGRTWSTPWIIDDPAIYVVQ